MTPLNLTRGDFVCLTHDGRSVRATVMLVSPNKYSLMFGFDGMLCGFVDMMPVLFYEIDGVYRALTGDVVDIKPVQSEPVALEGPYGPH